MAIEFTVDHNDQIADDAGVTQLIGWVTATVETKPGNYRVRQLGGPMPSALKIDSRKGYLAADGHMYADDTQAAPFRLVANDPAFNLRELTYRFDFDLTTLVGVPVSIPWCRGPAPSSDTTLFLARLMNDLDQMVIEVRTKGYAEDILDAGAAGIDLVRASDQASVGTLTGAASVIYANWYGAKGDGTTDDRAAIQAALNAAEAAGGGTVFIPAGNYKITNPLIIGDNVELAGAGSVSVIKPVYPASPPNNVIQNDWLNGNSNITLRNFRLDRSGANVQHGILLNGVTNLLVDGVEISGRPSITSGALAVSGIGPTTPLLSKHVRVVNCYFSDVGNFAVQLGYVDGGVMANNTAYISDREVFGVEPEGAGTYAKNVAIANNTIYGKATVAGSFTGLIVVTTSSGGTIDGVSITGNTLRQEDPQTDSNSGIVVLGAANVTISGNTVRRMGAYGIWIGNGGAAVTGAVISGNTVTDCALTTAATGIRLRYATNCVITGNYVYGANHTASIGEETSAGNNVIIGNHLRDTTPVTQSATSLVFANKGPTADDTSISLGGNTTSAADLILNAASNNYLRFRRAGNDRWILRASESSSSALEFLSRADDGSALATPMLLDRVKSQVTLGGSLGLHRVEVAADYAQLASDCVISVTDTSAPRTITLGNAASIGAGAVIIVKDKSGGAATNNITIARSNAQTIDGATSVAINVNYGAVMLVSTGTGWSVLANDSALPAKIHAATSKTTPADADELALVDSAASNGLKKLSWANLKSGAVNAKTIGANYFPGGYVSGQYYFTSAQNALTSTTASHGNNTARATHWTVTDTVTITRLFAEFTAAGDAGSVYRIGIWNHDPTTGGPGTLVLDAGSISTGTSNAGDVATGGTPGIYEVTVSQSLSPGEYWIGGVVQGAATTQPTLRINSVPSIWGPLGSTLPAANTLTASYAWAGGSGALGAASSPARSSTAAARIGFKVS